MTDNFAQLKLNGTIRFAEVLYFTRLAIVDSESDMDDNEDAWRYLDVAVIQLYSLPDEALLQLSSQTVASCTRVDEISVVDIKTITGVIAMIPHKPMLPSGVVEDRFFMLQKPGLDISDLGVPYSVYADDDDMVDMGPGIE